MGKNPFKKKKKMREGGLEISLERLRFQKPKGASLVSPLTKKKKKKSLKDSEKVHVMRLYARLRMNNCKINYANIL